jgi:hypothetical protein
LQKLNGSKLYIVGTLIEKPVINEEGCRMVLADAIGDAFVLQSWMCCDEGPALKVSPHHQIFTNAMSAHDPPAWSRCRMQALR